MQANNCAGPAASRGLSSDVSAPVLRRSSALTRAFGQSRRAGGGCFSAPDALSVGRPAGGHNWFRWARLRQCRHRQAMGDS